MGLTVQQLTEIAALRTRFLAGRVGGDRPVLWAHSTELPDPWNWLGTGDLLLTNGYNLPSEPDRQVELVQELNRANLSGVVFGERAEAPAITPEALATADLLGFPLLVSEYSVPWVLLTRIVADSNSQQASARLTKVLREYDVLRRSYRAGAAGSRLLGQLETECECRLQVIDTRTGAALLPATEPAPPAVITAVLDLLRDRTGPLPAFSRVVAEDQSTLVLPVADNDRAVLLATQTRPDVDLDLVVLQHAATITGLEVERRAAATLRRRENGARLLQQLLTGTIDAEAAGNGLRGFKLQDARPWRLLCWGDESEFGIEDMHVVLNAHKVPALLGLNDSEHVALVPASALDEAVIDQLPGSTLRVGASLPVHSISRLPDAAREARWALEAARAAGETLIVYGERYPFFLPRSVAEGESVVTRVLGPVLDYDRENDSQLLHSLVTYFDVNRSWQAAADELGVHRQTLIYRIRRVEEITGRRLSNLADQTELYLAVQTWRMLQQRT